MNEYENLLDDPVYQSILKIGEDIDNLLKAHKAFIKSIHEINAWINYASSLETN
jgi:hypothetical protein